MWTRFCPHSNNKVACFALRKKEFIGLSMVPYVQICLNFEFTSLRTQEFVRISIVLSKKKLEMPFEKSNLFHILCIYKMQYCLASLCSMFNVQSNFSFFQVVKQNIVVDKLQCKFVTLCFVCGADFVYNNCFILLMLAKIPFW